jgi:hypothetical protein
MLCIQVSKHEGRIKDSLLQGILFETGLDKVKDIIYVMPGGLPYRKSWRKRERPVVLRDEWMENLVESASQNFGGTSDMRIAQTYVCHKVYRWRTGGVVGRERNAELEDSIVVITLVHK